jgi:mannose-6-phosphate isomerase-like protein (cupin superfamily)
VRVERASPGITKGWYLGPWNSELAVSLGYATRGFDEPHLHRQMTEVYMVARGTSQLRVGEQTVTLAAGDIVVLAPGEPHTFVDSSPDYFHFVIHTPALEGEAALADRVTVPRSALGLSPP